MKYKPHDYQQYAIDFILNHPVAAIFLDMGMGKTSLTLMAICKLMYEYFEVHKVLIIAPLRVAKHTWSSEIEKWDELKGLTYSIVVGTAAQRMKALQADADIYVINRENVPWLIEKSRVAFDFDTIVIDELSSFKSWNSQRFKALMKVRPKVKRMIGLTGTPIDASIYVFYATMKARVFYDAYEDAGFKVGAGLIWRKPRAPLMRTDWKFNMEPIIWGWRKDGKHKWYGDQKQKSVFDFDGIKNSKQDGFGHPSSKPVPLIAYLIKQCTQVNGIVLDGFLGSASTLIACEQLGRICYGVELEPKFVDVAVRRYIEFVNGNSSEVTVTRDGKIMKYEDVIAEMEAADGTTE